MRSKMFLLSAMATLAVALAGCGGLHTGSSPGPNPSPTPAIPAADHVVVVMLENHSFAQVIGSPDMPYLNSLASQFSVAANYFAVVHPSIGNYFVLTTGQIESIDDNFTGTVTDDNVVRALTGAGKSWRAYMESIPAAGYTGGDVVPYLKHHDPFAYFSDVLNSSSQAANIVPFSEFASDLSSGALPNFAFVVPNSFDDAHDCPGGAASCPDSARLSAADNWLRSNIDPLLKSSAFAHGVLIITFDEGALADIQNGGGQVATILAGPLVKKGFRSTTFYQHASTLRVTLDLLQVSDHPGASATATPMNEFF